MLGFYEIGRNTFNCFYKSKKNSLFKDKLKGYELEN